MSFAVSERGSDSRGVCAAFGSVGGAGRAAVSLGDQRDDRQSETAAARVPGLVRTAETIERAIEKALREPGAVVGHMQLDDIVALDGEEIDLLLLRTPSAFSTRFVRACSTRTRSTSTYDFAGRTLTARPSSCARAANLSATADERIVGVGRLGSNRQSALIRARDEKQVLREL